MSFETVLKEWQQKISNIDVPISSAQRYDVLLALFYTLAQNRTVLSQIQESEVLSIYNCLYKNIKNPALMDLYKELVVLDIQQIKKMLLPENIEHSVLLDTTSVTYFQQPQLDEDDVLSQEGFLEVPEIGETNLDMEYLKSLGYTEYEC